MSELRLASAFLFVVWGLGLPLSRLLPAALYRWRAFLAPVLGLAIAALGVTLGYRIAILPPKFILIALAGAAAGFGIEVWLMRRRPWVGFGRLPSREVLLAMFVWLLATLLLIAPAWAGGDQFSVFQGNRFDTFGYLLGAIGYSHIPYKSVLHVTPEMLNRDPFGVFAAGNLATRPTVHLLYAAFASVLSKEMYRLHYAFLALLSSLAFGPLLFFLRVVAPAARWPIILLAAVAYPVGFWGQYAVDINAWSQVCCIPLLLGLVGTGLLGAALTPSLSMRALWRLAILDAVLVAGSLYIYPEGLVMYLPALLPASAILLVRRAWTVRGRRFRLTLRGLIPSTGLLGCGAGFLFPIGTFSFLKRQLQFATGEPVSWWTHFQSFLGGHDGWNNTLVADVPDFFASLLGLYQATPSLPVSVPLPPAPPVPGAPVPNVPNPTLVASILDPVLTCDLLRVALACISIALVAGAVASVNRRGLSTVGGSAAAGLLLTTGALLFAAFWLALHQHNLWIAGKVLSYASPCVTALLVLPCAARPTSFLRSASMALALAYAAWQLGTGVFRVQEARAHPEMHYPRPYPAIQDPVNFKTMYCWDLGVLERSLSGARGVILEPMNGWSQTYLLGWLMSRKLHYATRSSYVSCLGDNSDLGVIPPSGPIDWSLDVIPGGGFRVRRLDSGAVFDISCGNSRW